MVLGLFGLAAALVFNLLHQGFRQFRALNSRHDSQQRLSRAMSALQHDLEKADPDQIGIKRVAAPGNGDVVWFLSAEDPTQTNTDMRYERDPASGWPRWRRHIVYYLVRPSNVGGALDPNPRNDYFSPQKVLIRKLVDRPGDPETLMTSTQVDGLVTIPADRSLASLAGEPGVEACRLVADGLLSFEATRYDKTVEIDLRSVQLERAQSAVAVGSISLKDSPYTETQRLRMVMKR